MVAGRVDPRVGPGRVGSGRVTNISKLRGSGRVGSAVSKIEFFFQINCDILLHALQTQSTVCIQNFTIMDVNGNRCLLPAMFSATATCRKVITAGDQQSGVRSESKHRGPINTRWHHSFVQNPQVGNVLLSNHCLLNPAELIDL